MICADHEWSIIYADHEWSIKCADHEWSIICADHASSIKCADHEWSIIYADREWSIIFADHEWSRACGLAPSCGLCYPRLQAAVVHHAFQSMPSLTTQINHGAIMMRHNMQTDTLFLALALAGWPVLPIRLQLLVDSKVTPTPMRGSGFHMNTTIIWDPPQPGGQFYVASVTGAGTPIVRLSRIPDVTHA